MISRAGPAETQMMASTLPPPAAPTQQQGRRLEALNATSPPSLMQTRSEALLPPRNQRGTTTNSSLTDTATVSTTTTATGGGSNGTTGITNVGGTGGEGVFSPSSTFPMHKRLQRLASSPATNFNNDGTSIQSLSTAFDPVTVLPNAIQLDGIGSAGNSSNSGAIVHGHTSSIPDSILRTPNSKRADVPSLDGMAPTSPRGQSHLGLNRSTATRNRSHSDAIVSHNVVTGASGPGPGPGPGPNGRGTTLGDNDDKDTPLVGLPAPTAIATSKRPLHSTKLSSLDNKQYDKRKAIKTTNAQGVSNHATISAIEASGGGATGGSPDPADGTVRGRRKSSRANVGTSASAAGNNAGTAVGVVVDGAHRQQGKGNDATDVFEITNDLHQQLQHQHSHHHHPHPTNNMDMSTNVVFAGVTGGGGTGGGSSSNSESSASDHQHRYPSSGPGSITSDVTFDRSRQMMASGSGGATSNNIGQHGTGITTGPSGSGSSSGIGYSNQLPPAPSMNASSTKPMGAMRSLRFVEVEAPKLMPQASGDRPRLTEIDTNVAPGGDMHGGGVGGGGGDMSSVLDNSRFNIGVLDEERAALNDKILQERLLEAKAMGRSKTSGATMHKFSLWGGGGNGGRGGGGGRGGASIGSKSTGLTINIPNNPTPNPKAPTPSHSHPHPPPGLISQPTSPAAASVVSGTSSVVTGTTHATNKSMSNSRLRGPLAVREFVQSETFMGVISTSFHAQTDGNDGRSEESTTDTNANANVRGIKSTDGCAKIGMDEHPADRYNEEHNAKNERMLLANKPQVNITSNTKQQPSSHTGLATHLRSVVGKAKQLQTSISTGSENLGDIIRQAKSSGSKRLNSSSSSSSPYEEEQFEEEEEEEEGGEEEFEEEEEVIDEDDRVTMPSTGDITHHHHGDGDVHVRSPSGYHDHYDANDSSIILNRSVDSCADYIEDVPPSDEEDEDGKHVIEEVFSDGEIEEEEEMKEQFRRRNVRWSGNSMTSENSVIVTARSTRSSSARQTSARNSAARLLQQP